MSYCRFSNDDWQCDVYVYEDVGGGWTIHVAGNRPVFDQQLPPAVRSEDFGSNQAPEMAAAFFARGVKVDAMVRRAKRVAINGPHDTEMFNVGGPGACADKLEYLRSVGYRVPDRVIKVLREEQCEFDQKGGDNAIGS